VNARVEARVGTEEWLHATKRAVFICVCACSACLCAEGCMHARGEVSDRRNWAKHLETLSGSQTKCVDRPAKEDCARGPERR